MYPLLVYRRSFGIASALNMMRFCYYGSGVMKTFLSRMHGVLVSTAHLREIYQKQHDTVILWPPVFDETLARPVSMETNPLFRLGAFGGSFRRDSLLNDVMSAIQQLQDDFTTCLYLRSDLARGMEIKECVPMPFDSSYRQFISSLAAPEIACRCPPIWCHS